MNIENTPTLTKKIKRHIYGQPQTALAIFPAGFGDVALTEINSILQSLWFSNKYPSELSQTKNAVRIANIHMFALTELLLRSQCLTDIRLVIFEGKANGKTEFKKKCSAIRWEFFLKAKMAIRISLDSVGSRAFHETGLKGILAEILHEYDVEIVKGEDAAVDSVLVVTLYQDKLSISISLAGDPLYKRGFRGTLSASAPLREDAAACSSQSALQFAHKFQKDFLLDTLLIPFAGTGTFAFEYIQQLFRFSNALFAREYFLQYMPLFRPENFHFLLKKAREYCLFASSATDSLSLKVPHIYCIDTSKKALAAFELNCKNFQKNVSDHNFIFPPELFPQPFYNEDFFAENLVEKITANKKELGNIFLPLNPPYGDRLGKEADAETLYKKIALKINDIANLAKQQKQHVLGFILCPDEKTWSAFCKNLLAAEMDTYHFTQGGKDIRVCQFFI